MTTGNYSGSSTATAPGGSGAKEEAKEQARQVAGTAAEQGRQVAGTAADEARHVAGVAQGEAARVASEASSQLRGLVDEAVLQVEETSRTQLGRLSETLRSLGEDLEKMAGQGEGPAAGLAQEAGERALGLASRLEGREPRELVEDVRGFARRRPGAFLLGSLAAGVVAGRLTRGAKSAQDGSASGGSSQRGAVDVEASPYRSRQDRPIQAPPVVVSDGLAGAGPAVDLDRTGLPNPAASVAGDTSYATGDATGLPGGRA